MTDVDQKFEELENLIWALIDDQLTTQEVERIEAMLTGDDSMRQHYVRCMQLHADLHWHHRKDSIPLADEILAKEQGVDSNDPSPPVVPPLDVSWPIPGSEQTT